MTAITANTEQLPNRQCRKLPSAEWCLELSTGSKTPWLVKSSQGVKEAKGKKGREENRQETCMGTRSEKLPEPCGSGWRKKFVSQPKFPQLSPTTFEAKVTVVILSSDGVDQGWEHFDWGTNRFVPRSNWALVTLRPAKVQTGPFHLFLFLLLPLRHPHPQNRSYEVVSSVEQSKRPFWRERPAPNSAAEFRLTTASAARDVSANYSVRGCFISWLPFAKLAINCYWTRRTGWWNWWRKWTFHPLLRW